MPRKLFLFPNSVPAGAGMKTIPRRRPGQEWAVFLLLLLAGIFMIQLAATTATRMPATWSIQANMDSNLDPDQSYVIHPIFTIEPVRPEIITPPAWEPEKLLTSAAEGNVAVTVIPPMLLPSKTN